ncbi:MAG: VacB/RNase II family 3'-5' exoribonuclease [Phycisphaerales bacterium]|nr:VacB/RNase II family 3'-5' exoribonuclease [Phycisphaerales bacterium]
MPLRYRQRLLAHLGHKTYTPRPVAALASDLGVEDAADFAGAVGQLADEGVVEVTAGGMVKLPSLGSMGGEATGIFKRNPKGFGFVRLEAETREGDVFVPPDATGDALTGDRVLIRLRRDARRGGGGAGTPDRSPYTGEIVEILERRRQYFTGELRRQGSQWLVFPDGRELTEPVVVRDAEAKNAKAGDKVQIEITDYPQGESLADGVIIKVLGEAGLPDVETQAVIAAYSLPGEFPEECIDQARAAAKEFDTQVRAYEGGGAQALAKFGPARRDLTGDFVLTIDPPDAKDYDDAISIKRTKDGWELGVHIADVAHFIKPGSALDDEARERGNSVYLPRLVIPMLPEVLSNGICSLQEAVPRFCKSSFMAYDRDGNIRGEGAASTLIHSAKRLTYLEAQALIDGNAGEAKRHAKTEPRYTPQLVEALQEMNRLARAIQSRRQRQGMISLELPDVNLIFDDRGHVIDAEKEDDAFTHTLIEMFMVEANEVIARIFERVNVPLIRRIHPEPVPGDVDDLRRAARVAGFTIPSRPTREELQGLLNATRGTPAARAVHMAVLRTLTKAEYSPALIGHFALASTAYAHFTSPIRRYADLTVHRALEEYLRQTDNGTRRPRDDAERRRLGEKLRESPLCPDEQTLVGIGKHITDTEQNAEDAEHELRRFLVLQLMAGKVGEAFAGVVTGVSNRGVFIQIDKYLADGFIKKEDLPGDVTRSSAPPFWRLDDRTGALVDTKSGRSFNMGDTVTVRIAAVDLARRQMDLVIDDAASRAGGKSKLPKLALGQPGGGLAPKAGGFKPLDFGKLDGSARRSKKSKSRDKHKQDFRKQKKDKGKR